MAFELQGKIEAIFEPQQVTERFRKREFVVAYQDGTYTEQIKMQLTQDRCDLLDAFHEGDEVKVAFSLKGRAYTRDGKTTYFTNIDAWKITALNGSSPASSASTDPGPSLGDDPGLDQADADSLPF